MNLTFKEYGEAVDKRQAALEKQLEAGVKAGTLTDKEAKAIRAEFDAAQKVEDELRADGRIDGRDNIKMSTALNNVEIKIYELQRNTAGKQLKDSYVDVKAVDQRQARDIESIARGISNKSLTDEESIELLNDQRKIGKMEDKFLADDGKLDRGEFLRMQNAFNDFALKNGELQSNKDRWTGIVKETAAAPAPAPVPVPAPVAKAAPASSPQTSVPAGDDRKPSAPKPVDDKAKVAAAEMARSIAAYTAPRNDNAIAALLKKAA